MWYGKGPGVDRCGDVFKHANSAGTSKHGGVLVLAGDDHAAKSSTLAHQSEHMGMMTDQIPAAVWSVDLDLRFTSAFGASTTTINMDPNQVLGRTLFDYFRTQAIEYAPLAAHVRAMHGETPGPMRWQVGPRTFEVHIESLRNDQRTVIGAVGIAVDISERAAMEETVVEAEARVRTLAEQVSGSVPIGSEAKETGDGTVISLVG
jgi:PAS domain-containing protein